MDIEGTISSTSFVHKILFPYALEKMESYVLGNLNDISIQEELNHVRQTINTEGVSKTNTDLLIQYLCQWIKQDRKDPALKSLQGKI